MKGIGLGFILVILASCSKVDPGPGTHKGDFTLTGTVRDEISGNPIPYAQAMIMRKHRDAGWGGMSVLEKTQCDSLGQFALNFYADTRDYVYSLDAQALTYFDKNLDGSDRIDFSKGQSILQDVTLMPHGYLNYHIIGNKGGSILHLNYENAGGPFYQGTDTVISTNKVPMKYSTVGYNIYDSKYNLIKQVKDSLYVSAHDTVNYLIEF